MSFYIAKWSPELYKIGNINCWTFFHQIVASSIKERDPQTSKSGPQNLRISSALERAPEIFSVLNLFLRNPGRIILLIFCLGGSMVCHASDKYHVWSHYHDHRCLNRCISIVLIVRCWLERGRVKRFALSAIEKTIKRKNSSNLANNH